MMLYRTAIAKHLQCYEEEQRNLCLRYILQMNEFPHATTIYGAFHNYLVIRSFISSNLSNKNIFVSHRFRINLLDTLILIALITLARACERVNSFNPCNPCRTERNQKQNTFQIIAELAIVSLHIFMHRCREKSSKASPDKRYGGIYRCRQTRRANASLSNTDPRQNCPICRDNRFVIQKQQNCRGMISGKRACAKNSKQFRRVNFRVKSCEHRPESGLIHRITRRLRATRS